MFLLASFALIVFGILSFAQLDICGLDDDDEDGQSSFAKNFDLTENESHQLKVPSSSVHQSASVSPNLSNDGIGRSSTPSPSPSIRRPPDSPGRGGSRRVRMAEPEAALLSLQEEVDQLMDHSIEIDSNKKIRNEHVHPITLQFLQADMESTVIYLILPLPLSQQMKDRLTCTLIQFTV